MEVYVACPISLRYLCLQNTLIMDRLKKLKPLAYGVIYGLVARAIFAIEFNGDDLDTDGLMSLSFLFLVPFVIGLIVAYYNDTVVRSGKIVLISMPLLAVIGVVGVSVFFGSEGLICALMAIPIFALMSLIGAFIGVRIFHRRKDKMQLSAICLLPFILIPLENKLELSERLFEENTSIRINATSAEVWDHITRVKEIRPEENQASLFQIMGFPRPIKAELDTIAVGGIRIAIFDRGLFFIETVTEVVPLKVLAFNIVADPHSTPPAALDEHVMVGGKYFDVLQGRYELAELDGKTIELKLSSKFKVSTLFNFYSGFWSKLIMRDIQTNILKIIKLRCEEEKH